MGGLALLNPWVVIGFLGQGLFTARFLTQWIASERAGRSVVPTVFWTFSICGGVTLLAYALYREDPVFIVGQAAGLLIYARNIYFILRERAAASGAAVSATEATDNAL
ncbi:lipid-A-disaccharide synthase N-terminal domain-containing protein [Ancylobacter amanitiformis]|nr:lipid-A-disaccharide synthase N-terminal domain-containing protein [Ancylobacter amanitiformis]